MDTYLWLKFIHVVAAIVAVGTNVTYFVWLSRLKRASGADTAILLGIKALDSRLANPAYVVLPVTGILMVINEKLGFSPVEVVLEFQRKSAATAGIDGTIDA